MTKRVISALLAFLMISVMLVSCSNGDDKPSGTPQQTTTPTTSGTQEPADTQPPTYQPDPDCPYNGYVGFGTSAGSANFDDFEVVNKGKQGVIRNLLDRATFETDGVLPEFTSLDSADAKTVEPVADPLGTEKKPNKVVSVSGTTYVAGKVEWNLYRYNVKVYPTSDDAIIDIYFCIKDKDNYYVLKIGEGGIEVSEDGKTAKTTANCYLVENGTSTNAQFSYPMTISEKELTPVSVNVDNDFIIIYIDGVTAFQLNNPNVVNNYAPYDGEELPGSISVGNMGSPSSGEDAENIDWVRVDPEKVIHDGKGTWGNGTTALPTMVFDNNPNTFYDCDAKNESVNNDSQNVGIPGDGTFATGYVGAELDASVTIRYIRYAMRKENPSRSLGCYIEASVDGTTWVKIAEITETSSGNEYHTIKIPETITVGENQTVENNFKYVRFVAGDGDSMYCNVAELEIWVDKK